MISQLRFLGGGYDPTGAKQFSGYGRVILIPASHGAAFVLPYRYHSFARHIADTESDSPVHRTYLEGGPAMYIINERASALTVWDHTVQESYSIPSGHIGLFCAYPTSDGTGNFKFETYPKNTSRSYSEQSGRPAVSSETGETIPSGTYCDDPCYKLTDCDAVKDPKYVSTDQNEFEGLVGNAVRIQGHTNWWTVSEQTNCAGTTETVVLEDVLDSCPDPTPASCTTGQMNTPADPADGPFHTYCLLNYPTNTIGDVESKAEQPWLFENQGASYSGNWDICETGQMWLATSHRADSGEKHTGLTIDGRSVWGVATKMYLDSVSKEWTLVFTSTQSGAMGAEIWRGTKDWGATPAGTYTRQSGADSTTSQIVVVDGTADSSSVQGSCSYKYGGIGGWACAVWDFTGPDPCVDDGSPLL